MDLRTASASTFEPVLGSEFKSPEATFVLSQVIRLGEQPTAPRPEPFSLVFTAPTDLPQAMYQLDHADLGRVELFLVPLGPGPDGPFRYEAVFN